MIKVEVINELFKQKASFPVAIERLRSIDIERYEVDLVSMQRHYYSSAGESATLPLEFSKLPAVGDEMNEEKFVAILRSAQQGKIDYEAFLRGIVEQGVCCYIVFILGRKVVYIGRKGEMYTEHFPSNF